MTCTKGQFYEQQEPLHLEMPICGNLAFTTLARPAVTTFVEIFMI